MVYGVQCPVDLRRRIVFCRNSARAVLVPKVEKMKAKKNKSKWLLHKSYEM